MRSQLDRYKMLGRRWAWIIVVGIVICGGAALILSKLTPTVYQASTTIIVTVTTSSTSTDTTASIAAVPTYAQLLTNPLVLEPVLAKHPGMTLQQLTAMMTVSPQVNTQLITLNVQNHDPRLAAQLANEIGQSFEHYSEAQLPASIQTWPAQVPTDAIKPKPLQDGGIGALVGLGLAIALIIIFEWIDDRPTSPEEVQELLGTEILTVIPESPDNQRGKMPRQKALLVERYRMLCASLSAAQKLHPFKMVMITSAIGGEGKSTISANLASFIAMSGKRVLLVDANLRHPVLDQHFQLNSQRGLSTVFLEMWTQPRSELYGQQTSIPSLRVLTAGMTPARPAELLQSSLASGLFEHFKHAPFDYIIFDSPPLLPIADAQVMASLVETIVVVVDSNKTSRRVLARTRRVLKHSHARILGAAINKSSWLNDSADQQYPDPTQRSQKEPFMLIDPAGPRHETIMYASSPPGIESPSSTPSPWGAGVIPNTPRPLIRPPFSMDEINYHD